MGKTRADEKHVSSICDRGGSGTVSGDAQVGQELREGLRAHGRAVVLVQRENARHNAVLGAVLGDESCRFTARSGSSPAPAWLSRAARNGRLEILQGRSIWTRIRISDDER